MGTAVEASTNAREELRRRSPDEWWIPLDAKPPMMLLLHPPVSVCDSAASRTLLARRGCSTRPDGVRSWKCVCIAAAAGCLRQCSRQPCAVSFRPPSTSCIIRHPTQQDHCHLAICHTHHVARPGCPASGRGQKSQSRSVYFRTPAKPPKWRLCTIASTCHLHAQRAHKSAQLSLRQSRPTGLSQASFRRTLVPKPDARPARTSNGRRKDESSPLATAGTRCTLCMTKDDHRRCLISACRTTTRLV